MKYSKKQLQDLAGGCFQSSPLEEVFYASENGTFLNQVQYDKLTDAAKKDYEEFRNPAFEKPKVESKGKKVVETAEGNEAEGTEGADTQAAATKEKPKGGRQKAKS
jgi:hypothetical protein